MLRLLAILIIIGTLLLPQSILAGRPTADEAFTNVGLAADKAGVEKLDVPTIVGNSIKGALQLLGIFFFILMVYGGFIWMTARGNEERVTKAKNTIWAAIIGISIAVAAYAITLFVGKILK